MDDLCRYANRPWAFFGRYIRRRWLTHGAIVVGVVSAVGCSVSTQYGVKALVDALAAGPASGKIWFALILLGLLIGADNLLWRVASYIASFTFVSVTGDIRRDLFRHLSGHSPAYFSDRQPGTLASRVTATSNAFFTVENMFVWNVMPPCVASLGAILYIATVSVTMSAALAAICFAVIVVMFKIAAAGKPLHHAFADKAAAVDGEVVDLVGNMSLVRSFGGLSYEFRRFDRTLEGEMTARRRSLLYLENLRLIHALVTIVATVVLLVWVVQLWEKGAVTAGQVVLVATLGLSILHATRDLAVALVDATQHIARLSEALSTLLVPHQLTDHPEALELKPRRASVAFENVCFSYARGQTICDHFNLRIEAGQWVGLVGESGGGKSTLVSLLQRFYDLQGGRITIDGQDIRLVTQVSLREAITVVPQDISLFHRTLLENIRYGRPDASDEDVRAAAEAANCTDFIKSLPAGLDTIVGDRGTKLSGGQRQRVAIARAILKNAPILILDEATSALDSKSEAEVRAALENLMQGRTVIAIAHRLSTLSGFDRIVTLENGKIIRDEAPGRSAPVPDAAFPVLELSPAKSTRRDHMKIAQIAPLAECVPPKFYGGTERVVSWLTEELVRQGHEVTLFAAGGSTTKATLVKGSDEGLRLKGVRDHTASNLVMLDQVRRRADEFDIIHCHIDLLQYPMFQDMAHKIVTTLHGRLDVEDFMPVYKAYPHMPLISISDKQREPMPPEVNWLSTIYHGLPEDVCPFNQTGGDYLAFLGRISPEKRPDRAIEIAKKAGVKLKMAAKVDKADKDYFNEVIEPMLDDPLIEFIGEINESQKCDFLGNARALLFPIDWIEPFGLVMIEAMSAGTPTIAWRNGSVPEVIEDGKSGFIVDTIDEAVAAVGHVAHLDRRDVRRAFEARFTARKMAMGYVAAYEELMARSGPKLKLVAAE